MIKTITCSITMIVSLALCANAFAGFDVDDADSLDFESFHNIDEKSDGEKSNKNKEWLWDELKQNTRSEQPSSESSADKPNTSHISQPTTSTNNPSHSIQERYTLSRSDHTPYSAFYVIEALHKKMAVQCPSGWNKMKEWSTPVEGDFFLHYQFSCR